MIVGVALAVPATTAQPSELGGVMSAPERNARPAGFNEELRPEPPPAFRREGCVIGAMERATGQGRVRDPPVPVGAVGILERFRDQQLQLIPAFRCSTLRPRPPFVKTGPGYSQPAAHLGDCRSAGRFPGHGGMLRLDERILLAHRDSLTKYAAGRVARGNRTPLGGLPPSSPVASGAAFGWRGCWRITASTSHPRTGRTAGPRTTLGRVPVRQARQHAAPRPAASYSPPCAPSRYPPSPACRSAPVRARSTLRPAGRAPALMVVVSRLFRPLLT